MLDKSNAAVVPRMENLIISGNQASGSGGGIYVSGAVKLFDGQFRGNQRTNADCYDW